MKEKKVEEAKPFSTRMKPSIKKAMADYCSREGINIDRFVENGVLRELQACRDGAR